ncbi:MAG: ribose 5-phosphate isomerase B [Phycisphaeraceae bacterium]
MRIVIGGDHAGYPLKQQIVPFLQTLDHEVHDCGAHSAEPVDFPDIASELCGLLLQGKADRGIMCCGSGVGAAIAANKVPGIRAALCHDTYCARQCVEHDNVNVLCMGHWVVGIKIAQDVVTAYLGATFSDDPDVRRRVAKLTAMEQQAAQRFAQAPEATSAAKNDRR